MAVMLTIDQFTTEPLFDVLTVIFDSVVAELRNRVQKHGLTFND